MRRTAFGILMALVSIFTTHANAQGETNLDSLVQVMYSMPIDTNRLALVHHLAYKYSDIDSVIKFADMEVDLAIKFDKPFYEMRAYGYLYWAYFNISDYVRANTYASKAIVLAEKMGDKRVLAKNYQNMGSTYSELQDYVKSDEYFHKALDLFSQEHDSLHMCDALRDIGHNNSLNEMYDEAEEYFLKALHVDSLRNDLYSISEDFICLGNLDMARFEGGRLNERNDHYLLTSKQYFVKAYNIATDLDYEYSIMCIYRDFPHVLLAELYGIREEESKRRSDLLDSCRFFISTGIKFLKDNNYDLTRFDYDMTWAECLAFSHKPLQAKAYLDSVANAKGDKASFSFLHKLNTAYTIVFEELNDYKSAYRHLKEAQYYYQKSRKNNYAISATHNMVQADYEGQMNQAREHARAMQLEAERSSNITRLAIVIIIFAIILIFFIIYFMIRMRRANLALKASNHETTDSINYASLIQRAVMPSPAFLSSLFEEHVVFHKPLNIVSGDFYWASQVGRYKMIVAADCTGHGVPGAFLSMLGMSLLDYLVAELSHKAPSANQCFSEAANSGASSPEILASIVNGKISFNHVSSENYSTKTTSEISAGQMLNELRDLFLKSMHFDGSSEINDSIDLALVIFDMEEKKMHYAGAKRPLIIVHNGEIRKIKPDRMPIGRTDFQTGQFVDHQLDMVDGDIIYLFSDGFVDQFGYFDGHECKYTSRRFERLITDVAKHPLEKQRDIFGSVLASWRTNPVNGTLTEQTDDITIVGVKI